MYVLIYRLGILMYTDVRPDISIGILMYRIGLLMYVLI